MQKAWSSGKSEHMIIGLCSGTSKQVAKAFFILWIGGYFFAVDIAIVLLIFIICGIDRIQNSNPVRGCIRFVLLSRNFNLVT